MHEYLAGFINARPISVRTVQKRYLFLVLELIQVCLTLEHDNLGNPGR